MVKARVVKGKLKGHVRDLDEKTAELVIEGKGLKKHFDLGEEVEVNSTSK